MVSTTLARRGSTSTVDVAVYSVLTTATIDKRQPDQHGGRQRHQPETAAQNAGHFAQIERWLQPALGDDGAGLFLDGIKRFRIAL